MSNKYLWWMWGWRSGPISDHLQWEGCRFTCKQRLHMIHSLEMVN